MGVEWCMGMPPLVHILRPHEDVVGVEWCMGMPPLVHFLNFIFSSEICLPPTRFPPLSCFLRRSLRRRALRAKGGTMAWGTASLLG